MSDKNSTSDQQIIAERASAIMHETDYCAKTLDMSIDKVCPGSATTSMTVSEKYANGHGYCQGGIIATLADTAFAHACNSYNKMTVAQKFSIDFIRSAKVGDRLTAIAKEQSRGKLTGLYQIRVFNQDKKLVAIMTGNSFEREGSYF